MKKILAACTLLASSLCAQAYGVVAAVSIEDETKWYFDIELADNDLDFTAFQLDITLEGDVELSSSDLIKSALIPEHTLRIAKLGKNYRVLGYSLTNNVLSSQNGQLFSFTLDGDIKGITINKIIFAKPDGTEVEAAIYEKALDRNSDEDAVREVPASQEVNKVIYNMEGRQVYNIDRRGIYIQNGKKIAK